MTVLKPMAKIVGAANGADAMLDRLGRLPRPEAAPSRENPAECRYYIVRLAEALERIIGGAWDLPKFQR